jgi:RNA polymerase sigma-70 factor (ECF subfamily)
MARGISRDDGPLPAGHNGAVDNGLIRAVYNEHGQAVLAYATKLTGDRTVGEDVLQETLVRAWRHPEVLVNGKGSVRAWLLRVAGRIVVDRARMTAAWPREVVESPAQLSMERDHADQVRDSMDVFEALQKLSDEHREVIVQLYFRGCSLLEASTALGVPEGTVKSRSCYALRALRKSFGGRVGVLKKVRRERPA